MPQLVHEPRDLVGELHRDLRRAWEPVVGPLGRFPGETSALCLIWAVLELSSRGWRGVVTTAKTVAEIERLRRGIAVGEDRSTTEEVIAA